MAIFWPVLLFKLLSYGAKKNTMQVISTLLNTNVLTYLNAFFLFMSINNPGTLSATCPNKGLTFHFNQINKTTAKNMVSLKNYLTCNILRYFSFE